MCILDGMFSDSLAVFVIVYVYLYQIYENSFWIKEGVTNDPLRHLNERIVKKIWNESINFESIWSVPVIFAFSQPPLI